MHGAAFSLGCPIALAEHLGNDLPDTVAPLVGLAMDPVGSDEWVLEGERGLHAFGDGLLPHVQVAEPSDFLGFVEDIAVGFHFAHDLQLPEVLEYLLTGDRHLRGDDLGVQVEHIHLRLRYWQRVRFLSALIAQIGRTGSPGSATSLYLYIIIFFVDNITQDI